jgi:membrane complex biogenesis BtpA family protein
MPENLLSGRPKALVGMIHVPPTPGSVGFAGMRALCESARRDADTLLAAGFDALLVENMHDFPPLRQKDMGPHVPASLTTAALEVRRLAPRPFPVGIQVLFAAHEVAVAVALAADLDFVRVEAWTHGHLSDKGWVEASASTTVRYAHAVGATGLEYWADVKKKHASHAATADLDVVDIAQSLPLHKADAAILTGSTTGEPPDPLDFVRVRERCLLPLVVGSGLTVQNAPSLVPVADAFIVGTSIKAHGDWRNPVDPSRAGELRRVVAAYR